MVKKLLEHFSNQYTLSLHPGARSDACFYEPEIMSSPLHYAVKEGHLEVVEEIVAFFHESRLLKNQQPNDFNFLPWLNSLVEWAVRWGHAGIAQLLHTPPLLLPTIELIAAFSYYHDFDGLKCLLQLAAHHKHSDVFEHLVASCNHYPGLFKGLMTPLHLVAQSGSSSIVKFLLHSRGVRDVNEKCVPELFTPLHMATNSGQAEIVGLLLQRLKPKNDAKGPLQNLQKVDLLAKDSMGRTALHYVAREGHRHVVQLLLDCNIESGIATIADYDGLLALHMAARAGHAGIVKNVISRHPSGVNSVARHQFETKSYLNRVLPSLHGYAQDTKFKFNPEELPRPQQIDSLFWKTEGFTPLHFAARYGHAKVVRELVEDRVNIVKANLHIKDRAGFLAYDWMKVQKKGNLFFKYIRLGRGADAEVEIEDLKQASCVRKMSPTMQASIAKDIEEERKAMDELQYARKTGAQPQFTMRGLQWLIEAICNPSTPSERNPILFLHPNNIIEEFNKQEYNIVRDVDALSSLMLALSYGEFWLAKEVLLQLDSKFVLGPHVDMERVARKMEESTLDSREGKFLDFLECIIALVRYENLTDAANLMRWMLPWAKRVRQNGLCQDYTEMKKLDELVEVIMGKPELKRGLYKDRQVYLDCANAILVGAALIGGVAFSGWLQPPLAYSYGYEGTNYIDVREAEVRMFWRFNNAAFFFSVATLIAGAKGAVPVARETDIVESVQKVKRAVAVASTLLGLALVCVVGAFIEAGIAVLPPIPSDREIMHASAAWGCIICSLALLWFSLSVWPLLLDTLRYHFNLLRSFIRTTDAACRHCFATWRRNLRMYVIRTFDAMRMYVMRMYVIPTFDAMRMYVMRPFDPILDAMYCI